MDTANRRLGVDRLGRHITTVIAVRTFDLWPVSAFDDGACRVDLARALWAISNELSHKAFEMECHLPVCGGRQRASATRFIVDSRVLRDGAG